MQNTIPAQGTWYTTTVPPMNPTSDSYQNFMFIIPKGTKNIVINLLGGGGLHTQADNDIQLFTKTGIHLAGTPLNDYVFGNIGGKDNSINGQSHLLGFTQNDYDESNLNIGPSNYDPTGITLNFTQVNGMTIGYSGDSDRHDTNPNDGIQDTWEDYETLTITEATEDLIVWFPGAAACHFKAYWIASPPPSVTMLDDVMYTSGHFRRVPAKVGHRRGVFHVFRPDGEEQYRGVSSLAAALKFFRHLNDSIDYELFAQVLAASFPVFIGLENGTQYLPGYVHEEEGKEPEKKRYYQDIHESMICSSSNLI